MTRAHESHESHESHEGVGIVAGCDRLAMPAAAMSPSVNTSRSIEPGNPIWDFKKPLQATGSESMTKAPAISLFKAPQQNLWDISGPGRVPRGDTISSCLLSNQQVENLLPQFKQPLARSHLPFHSSPSLWRQDFILSLVESAS